MKGPVTVVIRKEKGTHMATQTMTERDMFLAAYEREHETTLKVLRCYPSNKEDWKPAEKCRNGRELAWIFNMAEKVQLAAAKGKLDFFAAPPPPMVPVDEIIKMYEQSHRETSSEVHKMAPADMERTIQFPVGPGKIADVRAGQVLWMMLQDSVHHRGQLSVYLRMLGARVPSIYGPSADEPWR